MAAKPTPANPADEIEERGHTEEEWEAIKASVFWFRDQSDAGKMDQYAKQLVAILGERVIDADPNSDELLRRVRTLGNTIPQYRVAIQYLSG